MATSELYEIAPLVKITDPRGNLTICEGLQDVPFEIKRVYWSYDVPEGKDRGAHAHKDLWQLIVAVHGSFTVNLDNGREKASVKLSHPWEGLIVKPGTWRTIEDYSDGGVCMVLASEHYDENDYIRDYDEFVRWAAAQGK